MSWWNWKGDKHSQDAKNLVVAMKHISGALTDEAMAYAWQEHEAGSMTTTTYLIVVRRIMLLANEPSRITHKPATP